MKFGIKYKLASIILIILLPIMTYALYHYFEMIEQGKARIKTRNLEIASNIAVNLKETTDNAVRLLSSIASHPAVLTRDSRECDRIFSRLLPLFPDHLNIIVSDMNGNNYGSGVPMPVGKRVNYRDREWFSDARRGVPVVSDLQISKLFRAPAVMIAIPVVDSRLRQVGVIGLPLNLPSLGDRLLAAVNLPERSTINVIDSQGNILIDTDRGKKTGITRHKETIIHKALKMNEGSSEDTCADGVRRLHSFSTVAGVGWKVIVGVTVDRAYHHAYSMSAHYIIVLLVVSVVAFGLSVMLSAGITKNLSLLTKGLGEIERGNLFFKLSLTGHDELLEVAESFNRMALQRRIADERVKESETFLSSVLEGIGEGVVVIDRNYKIISVNKGYCNQVKMLRDDILGKCCHEISHHLQNPCHEDKAECECPVKPCFETGAARRAIHTHFNKSGAAVYIEINAYPLHDGSGNVVAAIETLMDVTNRVKLEKELEDAKEHYRKLYDYAPDLMHSVDRDGIIVACNNTMASVLGYDPGEMSGKPFIEIIAPDSRQAYLTRTESLRENGIFEGELTYVTKGGRTVPVFLRERAMCDAGGNIFMTDAISRDISEKKSLEAQLLQAQKMEAIGTLAGGIAHDFNNILTAIMGYGNLMKMKMEPNNALLPFLEQVLSAATNAVNLTRSLLTFSRKQIIRPQPVNINETIQQVRTLLGPIIGEEIELKISCTEKNTYVLADPVQIEQVLLNLATNARDAMPEGGLLTIVTDLAEYDQGFTQSRTQMKKGPYVRISVTDSGIGMDKNTQERMFDPFFTTKEVGKGTGLGLAIVYGIVKQHNGYIHFMSEPGKGTTFTIYLPVLAIPSADSVNSEVGPPARGSETVLIAEDDSTVRLLMQTVLEEFGYTVLSAKDGGEAMAVFCKHSDRIQLLVLDVVMPKKNGREVFEEAMTIKPDIKTIFTSGYNANLIHKKGGIDGDIHFIMKPISPVDFIRKVQEVLHS